MGICWVEGSSPYPVPLVPVKEVFQQVGRRVFVRGDRRLTKTHTHRNVSGHVSDLQEPELGSRTPVPPSPCCAEGSERARPANAGNKPLFGNRSTPKGHMCLYSHRIQPCDLNTTPGKCPPSHSAACSEDWPRQKGSSCLFADLRPVSLPGEASPLISVCLLVNLDHGFLCDPFPSDTVLCCF